jgi:hypothetical protein
LILFLELISHRRLYERGSSPIHFLFSQITASPFIIVAILFYLENEWLDCALDLLQWKLQGREFSLAFILWVVILVKQFWFNFAWLRWPFACIYDLCMSRKGYACFFPEIVSFSIATHCNGGPFSYALNGFAKYCSCGIIY